MLKKMVWISVFIILASLNFAWEFPSPFINLPGFTGTPQITPEQAKEIVRQWVGDPNLQLPEPELEWIEGDPLSYPQYEFSGIPYYVVDAVKGYVSMVSFNKEYPRNPQWTLTPGQAEQIARQFCSQKFPDFSQINWQSTVTQETNWDCYDVSFNERLPNGAWGPRACGVTIHPDTGDILSYTAHISFPPPTWEPSISQEQALQIAINATGFAEVLEVEEVELAGAEGVLIWAIGGVKGIFPDGTPAKAWLAVDALNGELRYKDYSKTSSLKMPLRGHIMITGKLLKASEGPLFEGDKIFVSEKFFKVLGGDVNKCKVNKGEIVEREGKKFISTNLLKRALPKVVWDVIPYKERKSLYILLIGDSDGLRLLDLPPAEKERIEDQWFCPSRLLSPKGRTFTEQEVAQHVREDVANQQKFNRMFEEILKKLQEASLLASEREIKKEFHKPYVDWEKITKQLRNQKSTTPPRVFLQKP